MSMFQTLKDKTESFAGTAKDLNQLMINKLEQVSRFQLDSLAYYNELGIKRLRALSDVTDFSSARDYASEGVELTTEVAKKIVEDSKAMMAISVELRDEVKEMISSEEPAVESEAEAKPVAKKAPAKRAAA